MTSSRSETKEEPASLRKNQEELSTLCQFFNQISPESIDHHFIKLNQNQEHTLYTLEKLFSFYQLHKIFLTLRPGLSQPITAAHLKLLTNFLSNRWERIRGTDLAYPYAKQNGFTALCVSIAQAIASIENKNYLTLLMPSLDLSLMDFSSLMPLGERLKEKSTNLQQFILSDDDTRLIDVSFCLNSAYEEGLLQHTTQFKGLPHEIKLLSKSEENRIIHHSWEAEEYYTAIQALIDVKKKGPSIGAFIQRLIDQLRRGGEHGNHGGDEFNAATDANVGIAEFNLFLETLSIQEKQKLFQIHTIGHSSIGELWERLARPANQKLSESYCIEIIAYNLEGILQNNPFLYTQYPSGKIDNELLKITQIELKAKEDHTLRTKNKLEKIITNPHYRITSTYHLEGVRRLKKRLFSTEYELIDKFHLLKYLGALLARIPTETWPQRVSAKTLKKFVVNAIELGQLFSTLTDPKQLKFFIHDFLGKQYIQMLFEKADTFYQFIAALPLSEKWKIEPLLHAIERDFLLEAALRKDYLLVKQLLNAGLSPNNNLSKLSVAHVAVKENDIKLLKELSTHQADFTLLNEQGKSPIKLAIENKQWNVLSIMLRENNSSAKTQLQLVRQKQQELMASMLNITAEELELNKWNAAHIAALRGDCELMKTLAENKLVDFLQPDMTGCNPVEIAVLKGDVPMIQILAENKIDLNAKTSNGYTIAHLAICFDQQEVLKTLIDQGVNLTIADKEDNTPAHLAIYKDNQALFKLLLNHKQIDLNKKNGKGHTLLTLAIAHDKWDWAAALLHYPENFVAKEWKSTDIAELAVKHLNYEAIQILAKNKVDFANIINKTGKSLLNEAIDNNLVLHVAAMLDIDMQKVIHLGWGLIQIAAAKGDVNLFKLLHTSKEDLSIVDKSGETLAHIATEYEHPKIIKILCEHHFDFNKPNVSQETSLSRALKKQCWNIAVLILLSQPNDVVLKLVDKNLIKENHAQLRTAFIEKVKHLPSLEKEQIVTAVLTGKNKLGCLFMSSPSWVKYFFASSDTEDITVIKRELNHATREKPFTSPRQLVF